MIGKSQRGAEIPLDSAEKVLRAGSERVFRRVLDRLAGPANGSAKRQSESLKAYQ
jgi:hypothetical protein